MTDTTLPTDEGRRRYPSTKGYNLEVDNPADPGQSYPCTCEVACPPRCAGECGCDACSLQFAVFCDEAGLSGVDPWTPADREIALKAYGSPIPDDVEEMLRKAVHAQG